MLVEVALESELVRLWADALAPLRVRHPDRSATPEVTISASGDTALLTLRVHNATDTATDRPHHRNPLLISAVRLTYFPGVRLARQWFAAAWAGLAQHEALELVTIGEGLHPLDPHTEPYERNPWNRGLRDGFPAVLTPDTLRKALAVVMDPGFADALVSLEER